jgi:hypothetical protein
MSKISAEHLSRGAYVYARQSTADQLQHNHESAGDSMHWPSARAVSAGLRSSSSMTISGSPPPGCTSGV